MRVQAVRLTDTWKAVRANHEYPPAITHLLGELVAASTLLAANIKFDGSLVLQIQGDGPIALLVVECRSDLSLRATVKMREGHDVPVDGNMQSLLNPAATAASSWCWIRSARRPASRPTRASCRWKATPWPRRCNTT